MEMADTEKQSSADQGISYTPFSLHRIVKKASKDEFLQNGIGEDEENTCHDDAAHGIEGHGSAKRAHVGVHGDVKNHEDQNREDGGQEGDENVSSR